MGVSDEAKQRPVARDVAARAIILKYVVVHAVTKPPRDMLAKLMASWSQEHQEEFPSRLQSKVEKFWSGLGTLQSDLSPWEQAFARGSYLEMTDQDQINASWRVEAFQVLLWALELIPEMPPYDMKADHALLKAHIRCQPQEFLERVSLRRPAEIDRARGTAELWHWRSRTRQLIEEGRDFVDPTITKARGFKTHDDIVRFTAKKAHEQGIIPAAIDEDFPAFGKAYRSLTSAEWFCIRSITKERHFALNWLCGYAPGNKWDDTPTNT